MGLIVFLILITESTYAMLLKKKELIFIDRKNVLFQIIYYLLVGVGLLILLNLMVQTFWEIQKVKAHAGMPGYQPFVFEMSLWAFLFGILMQSSKLKGIFCGHFKTNWLIILTVIVSVLSFISIVTWTRWLGLGQGVNIQTIFTTPLRIPETHYLINALAGSLLVCSFYKKNV